MSEVAKRDEDGAWEPAVEKKGVATGVIIGVALGVGCLGLVCGGGILAAIAIPNFVTYQLRAKRAESPANVDSIRTAEKAYHAEWDVFTTVDPCPPSWVSIGRDPIYWESSWDCYSQFEHLGWIPDGLVRCRYGVLARNTGSADSADFSVTSECDLDGDGQPSIYSANRTEKATMQSHNNVY